MNKMIVQRKRKKQGSRSVVYIENQQQKSRQVKHITSTLSLCIKVGWTHTHTPQNLEFENGRIYLLKKKRDFEVETNHHFAYRQFDPGVKPNRTQSIISTQSERSSSQDQMVNFSLYTFCQKNLTPSLLGAKQPGSRRLRTAYTNTQLIELEKEFYLNKYLCR